MEIQNQIQVLSRIKQELSEKFNGRLLYLTISGAHLYGFESEDSDIDYRGAFLNNTSNFLGLDRTKDVTELTQGDDDIVLYEAKKEIDLALTGNCNVLEHLNAKPIYTTAEYLKLRQLINNAFGKAGLYNSYKGLATFNYKKFILGGKSTPKKYLYVFRGLMAGIYVLQTGQMQPNIYELNRYFKLPELNALIDIKKAGREKEPVPRDLDTGTLDVLINALFVKIDEAYIKSKIPEKPSAEDKDKINEYLKQIRVDMLEAERNNGQ